MFGFCVVVVLKAFIYVFVKEGLSGLGCFEFLGAFIGCMQDVSGRFMREERRSSRRGPASADLDAAQLCFRGQPEALSPEPEVEVGVLDGTPVVLESLENAQRVFQNLENRRVRRGIKQNKSRMFRRSGSTCRKRRGDWGNTPST